MYLNKIIYPIFNKNVKWPYNAATLIHNYTIFKLKKWKSSQNPSLCNSFFSPTPLCSTVIGHHVEVVQNSGCRTN